MDWLKNVGKTIVFQIDGSNDEGVVVYPHRIAAKITGVIELDKSSDILFNPIKLAGDNAEGLVDRLTISNNQNINIAVKVKRDDYIATFGIKGKILDVY